MPEIQLTDEEIRDGITKKFNEMSQWAEENEELINKIAEENKYVISMSMMNTLRRYKLPKSHLFNFGLGMLIRGYYCGAADEKLKNMMGE